ncbi:MAG: LytTR family transcriptional regulator, partial [Lachnospiraceae bacterium]|nr:LytTR family transcriptional regulator [Lachnospiraceae bacterium]
TIEEALPSSMFMRIHRSYIVNMSKVEVVERGQIVFGDKYLPVSDSYKEKLQSFTHKDQKHYWT